MHFKFIETRHPVLKEYLEGFYIFDTLGDDSPPELLVFPSNHTIISAYRNTEIRVGEDQVRFTENKQHDFDATIVYTLERPVTGIYTSNIREISFCFHPLGFNYFIDKDLVHYFKAGVRSFDLFEDFEERIQVLFELQDEELLQEKAEQYWLSKLQRKELATIKNIITGIQEDTERSIDIIAQQAGMSRQHITRMFDRHIGRTPSAFRKVARFRKALQNRVQNLKAQKSLTGLTYESLFYDQSHLIKDFHSLTGMTPKQFFKGNKAFKNGNINWYFTR